MSDFAYFDASVSRTSLGLTTLDLNDKVNYRTADQILGAQQTWNRQTARSPYVDGEFLVNATRGLVQDRFSVQVLGESQGALRNKIATLVAAFGQPSYILTVTMEDGVYSYACQPADYQVDWTAARWMARQVLVTFTVPRMPVAGA